MVTIFVFIHTGNYLLLSHLTTLAFVNGDTKNDCQEKHIFAYLVDFVQVLFGANFARGAFEVD